MNVTNTSPSRIDLHVHSSASDGLLTPTEVVRLAASQNVGIIGLTDHDTVGGIEEALRAGSSHGVEVIPGIELSTSVDSGELHMLGYFVDHRSALLRTRLDEFQNARRDRAALIVEHLNGAGLHLDLDRVRELAGVGSIGRAHVARALVEAGHVGSMDEAFERFLSRGKPGYVPRLRLSPIDAVELVHSSNGVAVLAHPFTVDRLDDVLPALVAAGLDGIEVFYSLYNEEQHRELARLADRFDLVPTGGSDYHGSGEREGRELGTAKVPPDTVDRLRGVRSRSR